MTKFIGFKLNTCLKSERLGPPLVYRLAVGIPGSPTKVQKSWIMDKVKENCFSVSSFTQLVINRYLRLV